jgi:hypothetical protein
MLSKEQKQYTDMMGIKPIVDTTIIKPLETAYSKIQNAINTNQDWEDALWADKDNWSDYPTNGAGVTRVMGTKLTINGNNVTLLATEKEHENGGYIIWLSIIDSWYNIIVKYGLGIPLPESYKPQEY